MRRDSRRALGAWVLAMVALTAPPVSGHSRERRRIDALEETFEQRNALLTQSVKDALDAGARLEEAIKERAQHADFLSGRIEALERDMSAGLSRVIESVPSLAGPALEALETKLEERMREQAEDAAELRARGLAPLKTQLDDLAETRKREDLALREEVAALRKSLGEFRTYLSNFSQTMDERLAGVASDVAALRKEHERDRAATGSRIDALLQAVNEENLKIRGALQKLAGASARAESPGFHVVAKGESLYAIARKYGISLAKLKAANPEYAAEDAVVHPGTRLAVPQE